MMRSSMRLLSSGSAFILACLIPGMATAQTAGAQSAANAGSPDGQEAEDVRDIVVTGSRTITNGDASPAPVTVVNPDTLLNVQPGTLNEALNILPIFAGSRGTATTTGSFAGQTGGNANANQLSLRNIGAVRTLVLLDGYRVPPTAYTNIVDVDVIPQMLIQRVDTVTGGVSAVYGSDAVSGVVNYILNRKFEGIGIDAEAGFSQRGDAGYQNIGIAYGTKLFGDRGHFEASYQYINSDGVDARSDRPYLNLAGIAGSGTTANPYILYNDVRQANYTFGGLITNGVLNRQTFGENGVLRAFVPGTTTGTPAIQIGGDGAYYDNSLIGSSRSHQVFARYDHELGDTIRAYLQFSGNFKKNVYYGDPYLLTNVVLQANNPYLTDAIRTRLANAGQTTFTLSKIYGNDTRAINIADTQQFTYTAGLEGDFSDFRYGLNYTRGTAEIKTTIARNANYVATAAALDAVVNPANTSQIVCNAALTNPAFANCVPLNVFGPTAHSQAALDYILQTVHYRGYTVQDDVSGNISGPLFQTAAGPVTVALSGEWRKLSFESSTDGASNTPYSCTGLRTNCVNAIQPPLYTFTFGASPKISQTVKEGAIEVDFPLLKDVPLIRSLSLNGAARYTDYDTSGSYWTWKIGGAWEITDTLRLRATRSRDIRAPTLFELFAPPTTNAVTVTDLKTNTAPRVPNVDLANPNLSAEIANTVTAGISWRPVPGLSLTADIYRIKVNGAIVLIAGSGAAFQNLCYASGGSSYFCSLQVRDPVSGAITQWRSQYQNYASIETHGADFEVNYNTRLGEMPLNLRVLAAYQPHIYYRQSGVPTIDQGGAAFGPLGYYSSAKWRLTGFAHIQPTPWLGIDLLEKWRNPIKIGGDESLVIQNNRIRSFATTNLTLTVTPQNTGLDKFSFAFNIANLFNAKAPTGGYTSNGTRAGARDGFVGGDDVIGRAFYLSVRLHY